MDNWWFGSMASNVASALILFLASLFLATAVAVTVKQQYDKTSSSIQYEQNKLNERLRTDITIDMVKYDNVTNTIWIYVKNTGTAKIDGADVDVYVNKERILRDLGNMTIEIQSDTLQMNNSLWDAKEVIKISVFNSVLASNAVHEVTVITATDVKDTYEFSV
jgi:archaellum component FlaG (FlaF/FlaG flagellin family)